MRSSVLFVAALLGVRSATALAQPASTAVPVSGPGVRTPATPALGTSPGSVFIAPGDYVRVTVWRKAELSGEFLVAADSSLKHPLYQEVKVAGLPVAVAQERIRTYLLRYEAAPQVSIDPLFQVAVGGEVRNPNLYRLAPETNVAQAVALAGGPTERGQLDVVRLLRAGRTYMLDLTSADGAAVRMPVESGDRIFIGRQHDLLRDNLAPIASVTSVLVSVALFFVRR